MSRAERLRLSPRLAAVARLAGTGGSVIDVGTDHGRLAAFFAGSGAYDRVAASDLNPGPLEGARRSLRSLGLEGAVELYLSDGLRDVPGRFDTLVLAGLGGETMVRILSACPWAGGARLVLQPQSKFDELEDWLDRSGFVPEEAVLVRDGGRLYAVLRAAAGEGGFDLLGALLRRRDPLLPGALAREARLLDRAREGLARSDRRDTAAQERLARRRERLESGIREVSTWQR